MLRGRNGKAGEVREACLVDMTPDFLQRQEWQNSTDNGHYWRRSDHPSSSMPVAAIQLPATRTAIRAHAAQRYDLASRDGDYDEDHGGEARGGDVSVAQSIPGPWRYRPRARARWWRRWRAGSAHINH